MNMLEINFLPVSFYEAQLRRRQVWRHGFAMILVGVGVIGYGLWGGRGVYSLRREVVQLEAKVAMSRVGVTEVERLKRQHEVLTRQLSLERELATPVMQTQVLSTIASLMPSSVAIRMMTLVCDVPSPMTEADLAKQKKSGSGKSSEPAVIPVIHVEMEGIAPGDEALADFIDMLTQHPLFSNVQMDYSRVHDTGRVLAHDFRMEANVRLDREYRAVGESSVVVAKEVVDAN